MSRFINTNKWTKLLVGAGAFGSAAVGWIASDPQRVQVVVSLLKGHPMIAGLITFAVSSYLTTHNPQRS